jgi:hypothetical protein
VTRRRVVAVVAALAAFAASGLGADPARGQVVVTAQQNLQFGPLVPGTPNTVSPTDVARRAALTIEARGRLAVSFELPQSLVAADGSAIPLVFTPESGRVAVRHKVQAFDPGEGVSIHINPADLMAEVFLGAEARPSTGQLPGSYTATIVMMVVQTGT